MAGVCQATGSKGVINIILTGVGTCCSNRAFRKEGECYAMKNLYDTPGYQYRNLEKCLSIFQRRSANIVQYEVPSTEMLIVN